MASRGDPLDLELDLPNNCVQSFQASMASWRMEICRAIVQQARIRVELVSFGEFGGSADLGEGIEGSISGHYQERCWVLQISIWEIELEKKYKNE
ncbi:hypothetical protein GOP47_0010771 [Adiantum capillus-veneris]|uniref:Uncharacterized protein n=1 Tax=Adiantum capillus-veneris TaxID=13818 RepID=A0A9D4UVX6_ADICA|nr:hypothetical protein GOP47_0010771 [Adiantum capillus-veneris]